MTLNNKANDDIIEMRRERVAQLRARQLSCREIAQVLGSGDNPLLNPETKRPYGYAIIASDLKALKKQWGERRNVAMDEHIDRQLFELQEIKRAGWSGKDPELARKALRDEMDLLGTKAAQTLNINFNINIIIKLVEVIEARGESASEFFLELLQEFADADGN